MPAAESGTATPTRAPDGTVDTHIHFYGPPDRYPPAPTAQVPAVPVLLGTLLHWAGDDATDRRILVDNAARLYGFGAA